MGLIPISCDKRTEIKSVHILSMQNNIGDGLNFVTYEQTLQIRTHDSFTVSKCECEIEYFLRNFCRLIGECAKENNQTP